MVLQTSGKPTVPPAPRFDDGIMRSLSASAEVNLLAVDAHVLLREDRGALRPLDGRAVHRRVPLAGAHAQHLRDALVERGELLDDRARVDAELLRSQLDRLA